MNSSLDEMCILCNVNVVVYICLYLYRRRVMVKAVPISLFLFTGPNVGRLRAAIKD